MSNKKYFTLIHSDTIHQGSGSKILPKEDIGVLLDAQGVLCKIKEDAELYRKEVIQESEIIKEQAVKDGFAQGYEEWIAHIAKLEGEITKVRDELQKVIISVALKVAKKIVDKELTIAPEAIVDIVQSTLKSVSQHKRIIIYVSKQDFEIVEASKNKLKQMFESLESLSLREKDDIEPGGCIIETEGGIINARLQDRWRTIEAGMEHLAESLKRKGT